MRIQPGPDPYAQPEGEQPVATPAQSAGSDIAGQWKSWIENPANRAGLMQFGIALTQPLGWGQNTLGQVGSALGQAGEAAGRYQAEERAQEASESKADLRSSQALAAEARAAQAGAAAGVAQGKIGLAQEKLGLEADKLGLMADRLASQEKSSKAQRLAPIVKQFDEHVNDPSVPKPKGPDGKPLPRDQLWADYLNNRPHLKRIVEELVAEPAGGSARGGGSPGGARVFKHGDTAPTKDGRILRYDSTLGPANNPKAWVE